MEAIPRGLVSRHMIKMIPGIKCLRTNILPSHHSGNHQFTSTASNKLTFRIPSFPNSYINTKKSFIRFVLKTSANGVLVPQDTSTLVCAKKPFTFSKLFRLVHSLSPGCYKAMISKRLSEPYRMHERPPLLQTFLHFGI